MKLAQVIDLPGNDPIQGPLPTLPTTSAPMSTIGDIITRLLPLLLTISGLILFAMLVWGGYDLLFSGGDPQKAQSARTKITNAVIGFVIIFTAYWLTRLAAFIFGLKAF